MPKRRFVAFLGAALLLSAPLPLLAQTPAPSAPPAPPPPALTGNVSFGLGLTSGNKDTTNINGGYELNYDPKTKNVVKSTGLFLFGSTDGERSVEQYAVTARDEYALSARAFAFGEFRYFHDRFKGVSYLLSPSAGLGYKLVALPDTSVSVSAGAGAAFEKDDGLDLSSSGAITFEEKAAHKLSATAAIGETFAALWKTSDFGDALYTFGANVTAAVAGKVQLKVELLDTYKSHPANTTLQKNDVSLIVSLVYKF